MPPKKPVGKKPAAKRSSTRATDKPNGGPSAVMPPSLNGRPDRYSWGYGYVNQTWTGPLPSGSGTASGRRAKKK